MLAVMLWDVAGWVTIRPSLQNNVVEHNIEGFELSFFVTLAMKSVSNSSLSPPQKISQILGTVYIMRPCGTEPPFIMRCVCLPSPYIRFVDAARHRMYSHIKLRRNFVCIFFLINFHHDDDISDVMMRWIFSAEQPCSSICLTSCVPPK